MLRRMKDLKGFAIGAKDGDVGEANDFISDDKNWTVRYRSPVVRAKRENRTKIRIVEG